MKKQLLVFHPHTSTPFLVEYSGKEPLLGLLQALVGGYVEVHTVQWHGINRFMFVNEDGLRLKLPLNEVATRAASGVAYVGVAVIDLGRS